MLDIKLIREDPEGVKAAINTLVAEAPIDEIVLLDQKRREVLQALEALRNQRNVTSKQIGEMRDQAAREPLIQEMRGVNQEIDGLEAQLRQIEGDLETGMMQVPNLPHTSVPVAADESENVVVRADGLPKTNEDFGFTPQPHWDLGPALGIIDFERGVKLSGSRFYVLKGQGARLQRALISWMLDTHVDPWVHRDLSARDGSGGLYVGRRPDAEI